MEMIQDLIELYQAIAPEILFEALVVFATVGLVKVFVGVEGDYAKLVNGLLSFLVAGGSEVGSLEESVALAGVAIFAALYHRVWEWLKSFVKGIGDGGGARVVDFIEAL